CHGWKHIRQRLSTQSPLIDFADLADRTLKIIPPDSRVVTIYPLQAGFCHYLYDIVQLGQVNIGVYFQYYRNLIRICILYGHQNPTQAFLILQLPKSRSVWRWDIDHKKVDQLS